MIGSERWFASLLTSPGWIDLIAILTAIEGLAIIRWRGLPPIATLRMLLPALCLLLALRFALAGRPWPWVPAGLTVALVVHLWDLAARWRR
ncbi:MAG: hypothetical protein ACJ8AI_13405 [Rhodopila sp.]